MCAICTRPHLYRSTIELRKLSKKAGVVFQKPLPQHIYFFKTPFLDLKTSRFSKINVRPDH